MTKVSELQNPYFTHDFYPQKNKKIVILIETMGYEGYGLYWKIVEFMHSNTLEIGEEKFVAGKENEEKVKKILNDFNLFRIENNEYISDRILRNIKTQEEKSKQHKNAASARWILANLKKWYNKIFDTDYTLSKPQQKVYIDYANSIKDFDKKLPDILYTLKKLRFENNKDFVPSIDWLLQDTNLTKMLNGGFGKMRNWAEHEKRLKQKQNEIVQSEEPKFDIDTVSSKADAIELVLQNSNYISLNKTLWISTEYKGLVKKFDLSIKELIKEKLRRDTA